jgi:hypothetical protein
MILPDSDFHSLSSQLLDIQSAVARYTEELTRVEQLLGTRKNFAVCIPEGWGQMEMDDLERALRQDLSTICDLGGWPGDEERARKWCRTVLRKYAESLVKKEPK